jgi:hypothetical protein
LLIGRCELCVGSWWLVVESGFCYLLFVFVIWLLAIGYWLLAMREALPEAGVLQGFHHFSSEEHEQHRDRDDTENGAGH